MEQTNPNLSTDFVKDMLAESPAKEPKAMKHHYKNAEDGLVTRVGSALILRT